MWVVHGGGDEVINLQFEVEYCTCIDYEGANEREKKSTVANIVIISLPQYTYKNRIKVDIILQHNKVRR